MTSKPRTRILVTCEEKRKPIWCFVPTNARSVLDMTEFIIEKLELPSSPSSVELCMGEGVLPASESAEIVRDGDTISVCYKVPLKRDSSNTKRQFEDNEVELELSRKKSKVSLNVIPDFDIAPKTNAFPASPSANPSVPRIDKVSPTGNVASTLEPSAQKNIKTPAFKELSFRSVPSPREKASKSTSFTPPCLRSKPAPISSAIPKSPVNSGSARKVPSSARVDGQEGDGTERKSGIAVPSMRLKEHPAPYGSPGDMYSKNPISKSGSPYSTPKSPFQSAEKPVSNSDKALDTAPETSRPSNSATQPPAQSVQVVEKSHVTTERRMNDEGTGRDETAAPFNPEPAALKQSIPVEDDQNAIAKSKNNVQTNSRRVFQPYQKSPGGEISTIYGGATIPTSKIVKSGVVGSGQNTKSVKSNGQSIEEPRNNTITRPSFGSFQPKSVVKVNKQNEMDKTDNVEAPKPVPTKNFVQSPSKQITNTSQQKQRDVENQPTPEKKQLPDPKPKTSAPEVRKKDTKGDAVQRPKGRNIPYALKKPVITKEEDLEARKTLKLVQEDDGFYANNVNGNDCTILQYMKTVITPKSKKEVPLRASILIEGGPHGTVPSGPIDLIIGHRPYSKGGLRIISYREDVLETLRKGKVSQRIPGKARILRGKDIEREWNISLEATSVFSFSFLFDAGQPAEKDGSLNEPQVVSSKKKKGLLVSLKSIQPKADTTSGHDKSSKQVSPKSLAKTANVPTLDITGDKPKKVQVDPQDSHAPKDSSVTPQTPQNAISLPTDAIDLDVQEAGSASNNLTVNVLRGGNLPPLNLLDDIMNVDASTDDKPTLAVEGHGEPMKDRGEKQTSTKLSRKLPSQRGSENRGESPDGSHRNRQVHGAEVETNFRGFLLNAGTEIQNVFEELIAGNHV